MTTATRSARKPTRVPCPHCAYTAEPGASIAGHVAMAHPEIPMGSVAPRRDATPVRIAERLAAEAPLAELAVLGRAFDAARHTEALLELEAASSDAVADLHRDAKALRKAIGARIAELAIGVTEVRG
jgi:hypothetical protein